MDRTGDSIAFEAFEQEHRLKAMPSSGNIEKRSEAQPVFGRHRAGKKTNYQKNLEVLHSFFPDLQPEDIEIKRKQLEHRKEEIEEQMRKAKKSFFSSLIHKRSQEDIQIDRQLIDELAQVILDLEHLSRVNRLIVKTVNDQDRQAA